MLKKWQSEEMSKCSQMLHILTTILKFYLSLIIAVTAFESSMGDSLEA